MNCVRDGVWTRARARQRCYISDGTRKRGAADGATARAEVELASQCYKKSETVLLITRCKVGASRLTMTTSRRWTSGCRHA
eukprot:8975213-Pyramimonas_sp.AAC.1